VRARKKNHLKEATA